MENPNFLKQKYWQKEEFRKAAEKSADKKERLQEGNVSVSRKPEEKIADYIARMKNIIENKGELFREVSLYPKYIVKPENISEDYIKNILLGNFAEMKGYDREKLKIPEIKAQALKMFESETGNNFETYQILEDQKDQLTEQTIKDQKASLDRWFEYLTSPEAKNYPDEFKYWAFAEMLKLGAQDRERKSFNEREKNTAAPFPELNQQALAKVLGEIERKTKKEPSQIKFGDEASQQDFKKRLEKENFGKLYGWALDYINSLRLPAERLPITQGEWKKFAKNSTAKELADTLQGFNTGWCIAEEGTAESYLNHSDVWIYFSQDENGENSIPRAAVVNNGKRVSEVRGIIQTKEVKQHLDDYIAPIVEEKLKELPGGETWQTGMEDMKKLAEIHFKHIQKQDLNKNDLVFLYELDHSIQSMGYGQDPRIEEIRKTRNPREDAPIVFECAPEEIAWNKEEINEKTKAYVGPLFSDIFEKNIENIFTAFPETGIEKASMEVGGITEEELEKKIENKKDNEGRNYQIYSYAKSMMKNPDFAKSVKERLKNPETLALIRLKVKDLGFTKNPTTIELFARAKELGLELCPAETGPHLRLKYEEVFKKEQPLYEYLRIGMEPITASGGFPLVFNVRRNGNGFWLHSDWARPDLEWLLDHRFVFCLRKLET